MPLCPNCGHDRLETVPLARNGSVWSYTVVRHRPPGDYRGPAEFESLPLGLVELPDGLRVLAPLQVAEHELMIGLPVELRVEPLFNDGDNEVVAFAFVSSEEAR